jgi:HPt (histidine-containing phosphotransfer) domain-containing protein
MDALEDAIGQSDRAQIRSQAHAIKGVAGTVGATAIQEMAQQIEESAELDTLDQVEVLVKIVRKEYKNLKKTIQVSPTAVT